MNNLSSMIDAQRQELVNWLEEGIACRDEYGFSGNVLKSMQIALAALTAQPDFYVHESDTHRINDECGAAVWAHRVKTDGDIGVYTAPPVRALKSIEIPKETGKIGDDFWLGEMNMRSAFIQAIRSAGYEVVK